MTMNSSGHSRYEHDRRIFALVRQYDERGKCASGAVKENVAHAAQSGAKLRTNRSSEVTASKVGTSSRNVERIRTILFKGDDTLISQLESGLISIHAAYRRISENVDSPRTLPVSELFINFTSKLVPEKNYSRPLSNAELDTIGRLAELFRDAGYLTGSEFSLVQERICTRRISDFGGSFNGKSGN